MKHDIPWKLLEKHFTNKSDQRTSLRIKKWLGRNVENAMILDQLQQYFNINGTLPSDFTPDTKVALQSVSGKIVFGPKIKQIRLVPILWKAAAVVFLMLGSWWLLNRGGIRHNPTFSSVMTTDTTQTNITLEDGSHIWLNAGSSIKYPAKFAGSREVYLEGEAYFEIAHDPKHPFIIHTANTQTRVLGTKFDIRAYPNEKNIAVTVTEGKVRFDVTQNKQVLLIKGQEVMFDKFSGNAEKKENDNPNFMAWKTHEFQFDGFHLESVLHTLAGVYHFNYQFNNPDFKTRLLTANFNKRPLNEILLAISYAANVKITFQNGKYLIW